MMAPPLHPFSLDRYFKIMEILGAQMKMIRKEDELPGWVKQSLHFVFGEASMLIVDIGMRYVSEKENQM